MQLDSKHIPGSDIKSQERAIHQPFSALTIHKFFHRNTVVVRVAVAQNRRRDRLRSLLHHTVGIGTYCFGGVVVCGVVVRGRAADGADGADGIGAATPEDVL